MKILEVVVGSKLHRLDTPDSDTDVKSVYMATLEDIVDPFVVTDKAQGKDDDVGYELRHFVRLLVKGNPTALEVLWSDMPLTKTPLGEELLRRRKWFLDNKAIRAAHLGYAQSQRKKLARHGLTDPRTRKHLVAHLRVLLQAFSLLISGDFNPNLSVTWGEQHALMRAARAGEDVLDELQQEIERWETTVKELDRDFDLDSIVPQYDAIRRWLTDVYTKEYMARYFTR